MATSGKNEALICDLKDGLLNFLEQLGPDEENYNSCLWFGGGDGTSYKNMFVLKKDMPDEFRGLSS